MIVIDNIKNNGIMMQKFLPGYQLGRFKYYAEIEMDVCFIYNFPDQSLWNYNKNKRDSLPKYPNYSLFVIKESWRDDSVYVLAYRNKLNNKMEYCMEDGGYMHEKCIIINPILSNNVMLNSQYNNSIFRLRCIVPYHIQNNKNIEENGFLYITKADYLNYMSADIANKYYPQVYNSKSSLNVLDVSNNRIKPEILRIFKYNA